jgi:L-seryl-tRNA(Ser) seleniumtransferase
LQHLDLDIFWDQWSPPALLIDKGRLKGVPQHGLGRPCKVGKEDIIGLLTALELFVAEGDTARHQRWLTHAQTVMAGLGKLKSAKAVLTGAESTDEIPVIELTLDKNSALTALELVIALQNGTPSIHVDPTWCDRGMIVVNPMCLQAGEAEQVARAIRLALG